MRHVRALLGRRGYGPAKGFSVSRSDRPLEHAGPKSSRTDHPVNTTRQNIPFMSVPVPDGGGDW